MIICPGLDRTFEIIKAIVPEMTIHEYPSGAQCEDWTVPLSWEAISGFIRDKEGQIIGSLKEHYLFAVPFSEPVNGWFSKNEIRNHVSYRRDVSNGYALEHRNAYNFQIRDWAISLPYERWEAMPEDENYYVHLEILRQPGAMKVAEYFRPGRSGRIINFCAHIDELCNDDLSGCAVALELIRSIANIQNPYYSYQVLLVPEMLGALFYVYHNRERVKQTLGMFNIETVGAGAEWCLKTAFQKGSLVEKVLRLALSNVGISYRELEFFQGYGNDERVLAWPTIGVPGVSLQRFPFHQYHTSEDNWEIIDRGLIMEALQVFELCVDILEKDYVPEFTGILQPWLTKHNLYYDCIEDPKSFQKFNNLVLFNVNGNNSILDLAELAGLKFQEVRNYLERFVDKGIIRRKPCGHRTNS
jgi:aminopeptidase-like protein